MSTVHFIRLLLTVNFSTMKFRGRMTELMCMKQFSNVVHTLSKLSKHCVLRLCTDRLYFIINEEHMGHRGAMVWCILDQVHFFSEYLLKGVSQEDNEIYLEFAPDMLLKALNSLKFSHAIKSVKIRLTNKVTPCLTFEVELPSGSANSMICVHDVPVNTIPRRHWSDYKQAELPKFDIGIQLPIHRLKVIRSVVDRMKSLHQYVILSINQSGALSLQAKSDVASVGLHIRDLLIEGTLTDTNEEDAEVYSVRLDSKKLSLFLASELINPRKVVCRLQDDKLLQMLLEHEDVLIHYSMSAVTA